MFVSVFSPALVFIRSHVPCHLLRVNPLLACIWSLQLLREMYSWAASVQWVFLTAVMVKQKIFQIFSNELKLTIKLRRAVEPVMIMTYRSILQKPPTAILKQYIDYKCLNIFFSL